jgi:two-component system, OmpR family, phosphate regulon sensor histidine kinase PhoR
MKIASTKRISIVIALIFALISGILILFSHLNKSSHLFAFMIFDVLVSFLLMYIALYYTFNNFIINKLKPIFDTIDTLQMPVDKLYKSIENGNLLADIDNKVMEWAKSKLEEIAVLKTNEKYRKEFLGDVSHELKTPLFNIQGYILTLIEGGLEDDEINMKYLKRTDKNINRLISIVKDLETIAKLETGERLLEYENFDIVKLITEVFDIHEIKGDEKKIKLKFDKKYPSPIMVRADKKRISDVLSNLLVNSIIYGKDNGTTKIIIEQTDKNVLVSVEDNGIGIAEQYQQRVFERFFRVDKSRSKIQGGTGLGLSIVKHTIEAHNQSITLKSQINIGTKFTFSLEKVKNRWKTKNIKF